MSIREIEERCKAGPVIEHKKYLDDVGSNLPETESEAFGAWREACIQLDVTGEVSMWRHRRL